MAVKTVFSVIGLDGFGSDIPLLVNFCRDLNAHATILVVGIAPPPPVGDYGLSLSVGWVENQELDLVKVRDQAVAVKAAMDVSGISYDIDTLYCEPGIAEEFIGERARYTDLVLIGPDLIKSADLKSAVIGAGLFYSARPVLVTPQGSVPAVQPKHVILGWDGRIEAARAAREALDFMAAADRVHITMVDPASTLRQGIDPGSDIATYLARHDVKATIDLLPSSGRTVADVLFEHASDVGAELIVMGGYGHTRLRERIFGGVTRSMIDKTKVPLLLMH